MNSTISLKGTTKVDSYLQIILADDIFFQQIGGTNCRSLSQILTEKDFNELKDAFPSIKKSKIFRSVFRIKRLDGKTIWALFICKENLTKYRTEEAITINVINITDMEKAFYNVEAINTRLKAALSLVTQKIFDYDIETKRIKIYIPNEDLILEDSQFSDWRNKVLRNNMISQNELNTFENLCIDIESNKDSFEYSIKTSIFTYGQRFGLHRFFGKTIYQDNIPIAVIGSIILSDELDVDTAFLEHKAKFDLQTNLLNKSEITRYAKEKINSKPDFPITIIIVDIDDFKDVNDNYGHMFGDTVLLKIASILKNTVDNKGVVGRIGGDEFFILLHNIGLEEEIRSIAKVVRIGVEWAFTGEIDSLKLSCSMGIVTYPKDGNNYDSLFKKADKALYIAKQKGKNRYIIYDEEKHGKLKTNESNHTMIDVSHTRGGETEAPFIATILDFLWTSQGIDHIEKVIEMVGVRYSIERINIFVGDRLKQIFKWGNYPGLKDSIYIMKPDYFKYFNKDGVFKIDDIQTLEGRDEVRYNIFIKKSISSTIQILKKDQDGNVKGMISFDMCKSLRAWRDYEISCFVIVGRLLLKILT